ncbi:MAG: Smr/MutS family protein [Pseudomonadota bacterium]
MHQTERKKFQDFTVDAEASDPYIPNSNDLESAVTRSITPSVPEEMVRLLRPSGGSTKRSQVTLDLVDHDVRPVGRPEAGLDRRTSDRLRKGEREPDARIDLHGMTAERAHRACLRFLADALVQGARVVLVITGKGGRRSDSDNAFAPRRGVLKESLPKWLRSSPLGHSIVGIYEASRKHGGSGAFYIYLKRRR